MNDKIGAVLRELEKRKSLRLLFAAESGSRAWGFASPDSDYDIRGVYVKPEAWYWEIDDSHPDTLNEMLPGELDISLWELRKTLQLFARSNPSLYEWLNSPTVYLADEAFLTEMRQLIPQFFDPIRVGHHYLAVAGKACDCRTAEGNIPLKKLFYALRGIFCARWSVEFGTMPPTEFDRLLIPELAPGEILRLIPELKAQKQSSGEKAEVTWSPILADFCQQQRDEIREKLTHLPHRRPADTGVLSKILRRLATDRR